MKDNFYLVKVIGGIRKSVWLQLLLCLIESAMQCSQHGAELFSHVNHKINCAEVKPGTEKKKTERQQ